MNRREFLNVSALSGVGIIAGLRSTRAGEATAEASVTVYPKREIGRIDKKIYGHFLEHVENVVYGGIYDPDSKFADENGLRADVIQAIKDMGGAHVIRWPGGNFVSYYHWRNGIGPKKDRPRKYDVVWGSYESNHFGTDEFLYLCKELECEPFITANMGNGTIDEACEWVEYCKSKKDVPPVKIWGLGNEHFGPWQVGYYTAEQYGRMAQQYGQFMRAIDKNIELVGVGFTEPDWNETVLKHSGRQLDWLTLHMYGHRDFHDGVDDFDQLMATTDVFEREIKEMSDVIAVYEQKNGLDKKIRICLEEWNDRHRRKNVLWRESPRNIVDALFVSKVFNLCQRWSNRVAMSNYVFLLNAHAPIVARPEGIIKSATYDVYRLYAQAMQPLAIQADVECAQFSARVPHPVGYQVAPETVVSSNRLDVSASRALDGKKVTLSLLNLDKAKPVNVRLELADTKIIPGYTWHTLHTESLNAVNTLQEPNNVRSSTRRISGRPDRIELSPHSLNIIELSCEV